MIKNQIKTFEEFTKYINNILIKNKKNKGFISEVKNLLCEEDYYSNNNKMNKNSNKINYEKNKNIKINNDNNKEINDSKNSNDIIFTQNDDNNKIKNKYINTYY